MPNKTNLYIGAHVSAAGGVSNAPVNAHEIGATALSLFTKNQRQWKGPPLAEEEILAFKDNCTKYDFPAECILPHASYLINLGQPDESARRKSAMALLDEVHRCSQLGITMINVHPGSHVRQITEKECLSRIALSVNEVLDQSEGVTVILENTAGQGSNVGYRLEQLAEIIEQVDDKGRVGVCMDTCHAFAAGYDLTSDEGFSDTVEELKRLFGTGYLRGLHINDSKKELGSHVDRHESLGEGEIGWAPFQRIVNEPFFRNIPLILETPVPERWPDEIARLFSFDKSGSNKN